MPTLVINLAAERLTPHIYEVMELRDDLYQLRDDLVATMDEIYRIIGFKFPKGNRTMLYRQFDHLLVELDLTIGAANAHVSDRPLHPRIKRERPDE
jgi:hypothetical protein